MTTHRSAALTTLSVTWAKQVNIPSTSLASDASVSSLPSGATTSSTPALASTARSGSTDGHT